MLTGNSGLFLFKKPDGTIIDISGYFDILAFAQKDLYKYLRPEIEKWIHLESTEIITSDFYIGLPINLQIIILSHLEVDYRFIGDRLLLKHQIELLIKKEESQYINQIYRECFQLALHSKDEAIVYLKDIISDTKREIIESKIKQIGFPDKGINLLKERLDTLIQIEVWIMESSYLNSDYEYQIELEGNNNSDSKASSENDEMIITFDTAINTKMMILNELGVLEYLESYIKKNGRYKDIKLYNLISWITGINKIGTIKSLVPYMRNKNHPSKNNPYSSDKLKENIERIIYNFNNQ